MALIFPIAPMNQLQQPVRSPTWSVHRRMKWNNIVQWSANGGRLAVELYPNNPLWEFEWTYGYLKDNLADVNAYYPQTPTPQTIPYTDLQILKAFYFLTNGAGGEFLYKPDDAVVVDQLLAAPDANGNTEIVHTIGGTPILPGGPPTLWTPAYESVQELNSLGPLIKANGTVTFNYTFLGPNTTSPYEGYVLHWNATPASPITATFTYYYRCVFSDDVQDYESFMFYLSKLSSLKFQQVRVVV